MTRRMSDFPHITPRGAIEGRLNAAKLLDEFDGTLISNSRSTRDVIDGITAQSHHVDDLFRRNP